MKCPKCGKDLLLRNEKVGENEDGSAIYNEFGICKDCKKKFNLDKTRAKKAERTAAAKTAAKASAEKPAAPKKTKPADAAVQEAPVKTYSNIPPKQVREQAEEDVKKNYDLMLDPEDDNDNEASSSILPIIMIILSILIIIAAIAIAALFIF